MTITETQAFNRTKTLPQQLQNALFSVQTAEIIRQIIEQNSLPGKKSSGIAYSVGLVLLGFIHPEDLAKEIEERAGIAPQAATAVAQAVNIKLFQPLRSLLEQSYAPALREEETAAPAPKIIEEIKKPETAKTPELENAGVGKNFPPAPVSVPVFPKNAASIPLADKAAAEKPPTRPAKGIFGEFARRGLDKLMGKSADKYSAAAPENEPLPKIIREEAGVKTSARINLDIPMPPVPKLSETKIDKKITPLRPVIIEMGNERPTEGTPFAKNAPPEPAMPTPPKPPAVKIQIQQPEANNGKNEKPVRIVHYSESRTPLAIPEKKSEPAQQNANGAAKKIVPSTPMPPEPNVPTPPSPSRIEQAAMNLSSGIAPPPTPPGPPQQPPSPPEIKPPSPS